MNTISSRWTRSTKWITPLIVFIGIPALLLLPKDEDFGGVKGYLLWALLFVVGLVSWRLFVADLADEVEDHGDWLLVRRGSIEEKVLLSNVTRVKDSGCGDSPRIVLRLIVPSRLGRQIAFMPEQDSGWAINPFARTEIGESLIARVEQVRAQLRNKP